MKEKLHIVFGKSTSGLLRMSFKYSSSIFGNILSLNDDMSMGPITNLDNISGIRVRKNWWDTVTKDTYYNTWVLNEVDANIEKYQYIKNDLKKQTYVWVGNDATSIVGFIRLMDKLEGIDKELFLIDCSHKYTRAKNSITGISSFNYTQSLDPKIMASLFFQAGKINVDKRRAVAEKWKQLLFGHDNLRISKINGDIQGVAESYYDSLLLAECGEIFKNATNIIAKILLVLENRGQKVDYIYLNWRLKELIKHNKLVSKGCIDDINTYKVARNI